MNSRTTKLTAALIFLIASFTSGAQINQADQQKVPLIDRSLFFDNPEITYAKLSPDGKYISFLKAYNCILNIWVKKFDEPFNKAKRLTNLEQPVSQYFWTYDGKYILYLKDKGGNENYNILLFNPMLLLPTTAFL